MKKRKREKENELYRKASHERNEMIHHALYCQCLHTNLIEARLKEKKDNHVNTQKDRETNKSKSSTMV